MTNVECPLCRIKMDIEFDYDYDYELRFFWCDDCKNRIRRYWKPFDLPLRI